MPKIFISYRRNDSAAHSGRIYDRLEGHFGQGQVFMDVDTIRPGLDFVEVVQEAVGSCDALIAVIGREWLEASDGSGRRRLENPEDLVRLEIATALGRDIRVIPVLVQGARMPVAPDLPEGLEALARRNSVELSDIRFRSDVEQLIEALEAPTERVEDTVFVEPAQRSGSGFVGRERELGELNTALEETLAGQGRLVMLVGEPGIGKTRIAQEFASRAERRGAQVFWGRCYEEEGAPPYWPWVQAVRSYVQQTNAEQLQTEMGAGAAAIAESFPELREKLPGLEPPPSLEPEQARFRLFDSITSFLKNAAQSQPLMLVLDDLHWADKPSLFLLQFAAREMAGSRLLVVGTYRDVELSRQHPLSETLAQLSREPVFRRELLRGLNQEDSGRFIEDRAGIHPPQQFVETLYTHTEGNPFFLSEVIQLMADRGELTAEDIGGPQGIRIPEGVREVLGQRLNRLSDQCNQALTTASVIGREFDFQLLAGLSAGITEDQMLEAIDEAVSAGLIEALPDRIESYRFSHALIQQTLSEGLNPSRMARLHARIAQALEDLYGAAAEARAAELAYHFAEAGTVASPAKLVRYSLLAGQRALATYAYEEAVGHFQRALGAKEGQATLVSSAPPMDAETAELLYGLGRAQAATLPRLELQEAYQSLTRAFDFYAAVGDLSRIVAIAEIPGPILSERSNSVGHLTARALEIAPADSHEAARLLSVYGLVQGMEVGDHQGAQDSFDKALAIAKREGDAALEMRTQNYAAQVDLWHHRFRESLDRSLRAIELARAANDLRTEVGARYWAALALRTIGDLEGLRHQASTILNPAERLRDRYWLTTALSTASFVPVVEGAWDDARELNDRGLNLMPMDPRLLIQRVVLEFQIGDYVKGEAFLERMLEVVRLSQAGPTTANAALAFASPVAASISGAVRNSDSGEASIAAVLSSPAATPFFTIWARTGASLLAVMRGESDLAREHYAALKFSPGLMIVYVSSDRVLGLLAQTMGNMDQAAAHFEDSLAFCRKAGYRPELAWTCCDYADNLLQRNNPGDREKAIYLLDESLAITTELGMQPLMERVLSRREILQA